MSATKQSYKIAEERLTDDNDFFEHLAINESDLSPNKLYYRDDTKKIWLYHANCLELMDAIIAKYPLGKFDMIFADPPYFLSNGGN